MSSTRKIVTARRNLARLRLEADGATPTDIAIWEAGCRVADLEREAAQSQVSTARRAALGMDIVITVVAALTMGFSLGNIHQFGLDHGVSNPIAWFLAPAVDLALLGALMGDAVLSRCGLVAGPWATVLRWFAGLATLGLNSWEAVAAGSAAGIFLHAVPPILLIVLAEAAVPYRRRFAESVEMAQRAVEVDTDRVQVDSSAVHPVSTLAATLSTPALQAAPAVQPADADPLVICGGHPAKLLPAPVDTRTDAAPARLDADEAKAAIGRAWEDGLSLSDAARVSTRSRSYVAKVYAALEDERGSQPMAGQLALVK